MKRLFIVASLAILAIACQKTEVQNLVTNEIGFNTEIGKQTRTIVNGTTFTGTFGVFAYGHATTVTTVMDNVEIAKNNTSGKWVAKPVGNETEGHKYYWPNDVNTYLNFYAYYPYEESAVVDETNGYQVTVDVSDDPYYDLMVAEPVRNEKYTTHSGVVPLTFAHQMTQVVFNVSSTAPTGITFDVTSITLDNVVKTAEFVQISEEGDEVWTEVTFFNSGATPADPCSLVLTGNPGNETTTAVTMVPQALTEKTFTVVYTISGEAGSGVANETVTKTLPLAYTIPVVDDPATDDDESATPINGGEWIANKKVTYNLTIGLNEISFNPIVTDWNPVHGSTDITIM